MKKCACDESFHRVGVTPLPSVEGRQVLHIQTNCLQCGSGWAEVTDEPIETVTVEE